jgi:hypothetical protein
LRALAVDTSRFLGDGGNGEGVTLADISQGSLELTLSGNTYHLRKLTVGNTGEIQSWVRTQLKDPWETLRDGLDKLRPANDPPEIPKPPKAPKEMTGEEAVAWATVMNDYKFKHQRWTAAWKDYELQRNYLLEAARQDAKGGNTLDGRAAQSILTGIAGTAMIIWVSCRDFHPGITREKIEKDLDGADLQDAQAQLDRLNRLPDAIVKELEKK